MVTKVAEAGPSMACGPSMHNMSGPSMSPGVSPVARAAYVEPFCGRGHRLGGGSGTGLKRMRDQPTPEELREMMMAADQVNITRKL